MSPPCSLTGETTPSTTSSTRAGSSVGLRSLISSRRPTTRSTGLTSCSVPAALPLPRGVRMWSYTNASAMTSYSEMGNRCQSENLRSIVTLLLSPSRSRVLWHRSRRRVMDDDSVESLSELLTLDELTTRVGMSVRNIRFYTTKGLVPPPLRRGRSGYYTPDHVARLQLVQELQGHGFTLSAIERYLAGIPDHATPEDIALHRTMLAPWMADSRAEVSRTELEQRAGRRLDARDLETLEALGVLAPV